MLTLRMFVLGLVTCGLFTTSIVFSEVQRHKSAIYQMAEIMHRLKHFPSPVGKDVLSKIVRAPSSSENERAIATSMINIQHKAAASDIPKLRAIITNKKSTPHERELASIVLWLDHRPSIQDKDQLKAMMQ